MLIGVIAAGRRRVSGSTLRGYTFGAYPYFIYSTLNFAGSSPEGLLREQGQPDFDNLNFAGSSLEGTLVTTSNYISHTLTDIDVLNFEGSSPEGTLVTTAAYATHTVYDIDNINVGAGSPEANLS